MPRKGGDHRGSAESRRRRKQYLLDKYGNGQTCECVHCLVELTFDTVESDRIEIGGSYARANVQPACRSCNASRQRDGWISPRIRLQHA